MNPLHELIRRLPPGVEFLVVVMWAFGLPIFSSILSVGAADDGIDQKITNTVLFSVLVTLLLQSLFLIWFLRIRGWTLEKLGLVVSWRGTVFGIALAAVTYALLRGVVFVADLALPVDMKVALDHFPAFAKDVNMNLVYVVAAVAGIFEEVFVAGYIIAALSQVRGPWTGINVSVGTRLLCALSQGPMGVLLVVPQGLLFAYVFARTRMLWPLIVAHLAVETVGLLSGYSS